MTDRNPRQEGAAKRGKYAKGLARRQQIIDEVLTVYDRLGFEGTSLRAVAEAIGVTHPVLKHHFGTREQLFLEVLQEYDRRFLDSPDADDGTFVDLVRRSAEHSMRVPGLMALLNSMVAHALEAGNDRSRAHFSERYADLRGRSRPSSKRAGRREPYGRTSRWTRPPRWSSRRRTGSAPSGCSTEAPTSRTVCCCWNAFSRHRPAGRRRPDGSGGRAPADPAWRRRGQFDSTGCFF